MHRFSRALQLRQLQTFRPLRRIGQYRAESQYVYRKGGDRLRYQNVRFVSPRSVLRTTGGVIITAVALSVVSRYILRGYVIEVLPEDAENQNAVPGQGGISDGELEDDDPLFIPLTWSTQLPRTYYKGSDPEWQHFVKFAKDSDKRKKVLDELAQMILKSGSKHPALQSRLGDDLKIGKVWLETTFPDGPPPDYERLGIAVGDGYVAICSQTITADEHWEWMRRMWPSAVGESSFSAMKMLMGMQYRRLKQALGLEGADPMSPEEKHKRTLALMEQASKSADGAQPSTSTSTSAVLEGSAGPPSQRPTTNDEAKRSSWQIPMSLAGSSAESGSIESSVMFHTFYSELRKKWSPKKFEAPRGTFLVHGLIELTGSRGRLIMDVTSCYDPSKNKYIAVNARQRTYKRKTQVPRGGP